VAKHDYRLVPSGILGLAVWVTTVACASDASFAPGSLKQAVDGGVVDAIPPQAEPVREPFKQCKCPNGDCATRVTADKQLELPVPLPVWCISGPQFWGRHHPAQFLLGGCGFIGLRESIENLRTGEFSSVEEWFDPLTFEQVGRSAFTTATGLHCEGRIPVADCAFVSCSTCEIPSEENNFRRKCDLADVATEAQ
jgi:hypothetical protein